MTAVPAQAAGGLSTFSLGEFLFSGVGRAGRRAYVLGLAVCIAAYEVYERVGALAHWITGWIAYPALMAMAASVIGKRLHDRGGSGWWAVLPIFAYPMVRPWPEGILGGVALGIVLSFGGILAVVPGDAGFNRFGPRPG